MHELDFVRGIQWIINHEDISGTYNFAAPNPVENAEFMRLMREACDMRFGFPASEWMLEIGAFFMRTETELILKSRRVVPTRLLQTGFKFKYPFIQQAIPDLVKE
jgi:NAD dependent epimerase/dehydratase family enzyme